MSFEPIPQTPEWHFSLDAKRCDQILLISQVWHLYKSNVVCRTPIKWCNVSSNTSTSDSWTMILVFRNGTFSCLFPNNRVYQQSKRCLSRGIRKGDVTICTCSRPLYTVDNPTMANGHELMKNWTIDCLLHKIVLLIASNSEGTCAHEWQALTLR